MPIINKIPIIVRMITIVKYSKLCYNKCPLPSTCLSAKNDGWGTGYPLGIPDLGINPRCKEKTLCGPTYFFKVGRLAKGFSLLL